MSNFGGCTSKMFTLILKLILMSEIYRGPNLTDPLSIA